MKADFTRKLLEWNRNTNQRPMPWKGEKNPYKIWLSEIILQQTRVQQGWAYYEKFINAYPDIHALAAAPEEEVFKLWEGLGYYSRCRNLLKTARYISKERKGKFPRSYEEILQLKGVGPYTAAAISSFAFGEPKAVLDGNVQRVLSRYFGIQIPAGTAAAKKLFQQLADNLIDPGRPGVYNQALMDFGAVICRPKQPLCDSCCQRKQCVALALNRVNELPVKVKKAVKIERWFYYYFIRAGNKFYVRKRNNRDIWQSLYEFVLFETSQPLKQSPEKTPFLKKIMKGHSYSVMGVEEAGPHHLSHQTIRGYFVLLHTAKPLENLTGYQLVNVHRMNELAFPRYIRRFLDNLHNGKP